MTEEEKIEKMMELGKELGHVITLREDPKPIGADPQVWEMLDKPRAVYKEDQRTLKNVVRPRSNCSNFKRGRDMPIVWMVFKWNWDD